MIYFTDEQLIELLILIGRKLSDYNYNLIRTPSNKNKIKTLEVIFWKLRLEQIDRSNDKIKNIFKE